MSGKHLYEKFGYGLFLLKTKNSLFNADFSHEPRQLPDGTNTLYATDKSLKYCIRKYVHDVKEKDYPIFFWRRCTDNDKLKPMDLGENYQELFKTVPPKGGNKEVESKLLTCWDVRVFGATFAESECSVSITGPMQITYGINKTDLNQKYSNQILSPFRNSKESSEDKQQRTMGAESKALEGHLAFDYIINPKTLRVPSLTVDDVDVFKEALCKGVSYVNSSAKIGSESEFMLYIESNDYTTNTTLPLLKDLLFVQVKETGRTTIDLKRISELLKEHGLSDKNVSVYYEPASVDVENAPAGAQRFNIHTLQGIKK